MFRRCYAMEKIHGTSANISFEKDGNEVALFSGGVSQSLFDLLFDTQELLEGFRAIREDFPQIVVFGEAYGGSCQGMQDTYGKDLKFIAFEVNIGGTWEGTGRKRKIKGGMWLSVPRAEQIARGLGLDFVHYEEGPATLEWIDGQLKKPSTQAFKNGIEGDKITEGVVIRPLQEFTTNNGGRVISKHKNENFEEHRVSRSKRVKDPAIVRLQEAVQEIANDWVVPNRLEHVLDKLVAEGDIPHEYDMKHTSTVIKEMCADIQIEGKDEIKWSKAARGAINKKTANLYKDKVRERANS